MGVFKFKKFSLTDTNTPMKIGMDSVMLGAWASVPDRGYAIDIGSGCGLLSFMLAQRSPDLQITGVEIYEPAYDDSIENLSGFRLVNNIRFFNNDINDWHTENSFDLIITNPPFFTGELKPEDEGRSFARFQDFLPADILISNVLRLLKKTGRFALVLPFDGFNEFNGRCVANGLLLYKKTIIKHRKSSNPKRILLEYGFDSLIDIAEDELVIKNDDDGFTDEYKNLTKDFYLAF